MGTNNGDFRMSGSVSIKNFPYNVERMKYASDGIDCPEITVDGSGFGSPPNIALYRDWSRDALGQMSLTNNMVGPDFQLQNAGLYPNIIAGYGRNGVAHREGGATASTNNRQTTFYAVFPQPFRNFRIGFDLCTPPGRTFSGCPNPGQMPDELSSEYVASVMKVVWVIDRVEGGPPGGDKADMVVATYTGDGFHLDGNTKSYNLKGTELYDFNDWNYFQGCAVAGTPDPFVNNGIEKFICSNALQDTKVATKTDVPSFGGGATDAQYDRVSIHAWSGNGASHDLALHLMSHFYMSTSNDLGINNYIEITDSATSLSSKKRWYIPHKTWSDTQIKIANPQYYKDYGFTHCHIQAGSNYIVRAL